MKTLGSFLLFAAMVTVTSIAAAEQKTNVKLKDGSIIYGNIIVQRPGVDITIDSDSAKFIVDNRNILSSSSKKVRYEDLTRDWKRWSIKKKVLKGNANGRYMIFCNIKTKRYALSDVFEFEYSKDGIHKYYNNESCIYKILWSDIAEIIRTVPSANVVDCIDDEIITFKGENYRGTIVSQILDKQFTIKTKGGACTVPSEEVFEIRKFVRNGSSSINKIANYKNTLVLNNGISKDGILLSQRYGKNAGDRYITLLLPNGKTEKVPSNDIVEYKTNYNKQKKVIYKSGMMYVNEFMIKKADTRIEGLKCLYIDKKVFSFPEGIVITFKTPGSSLQNDWYLVALESLNMEKGGVTKGFTPEIKASNAIKPSSADLVDGISSISFDYLSPGYYSLVTSSGTDTYIIKITP